jgi:hypothetical protein
MFIVLLFITLTEFRINNSFFKLVIILTFKSYSLIKLIVRSFYLTQFVRQT